MTYYVEVRVTKSFDSEKAAEEFAADVIKPIKGVDYEKSIRYINTEKFHKALTSFTYNTNINNPVLDDSFESVQKHITKKAKLGLMDQ